MKNVTTSQDLGSKDIKKLLIQFAIPSIIAMTCTSIYNISDSIFIGQGVGVDAIAGLAISFPIMNLATAVGTLVGVGAGSYLSLKLGQKDTKTASDILGNVFIMNIVLGLLFTFIMLLFLEPMLLFFGASPQIKPYARDFLVIILGGNCITHLYFGLNTLIRASGSPKTSMYCTITTVVINLLLNPLFIFGFKWGIKGSAIATVISQFIVLLYQIYLLMDKSYVIHIKKDIFRLRPQIVKSTFAIGMAPFIINSVACVVVIFINQGLSFYGALEGGESVGDLQVGAYGIVNRVVFLFVMIVLGLSQGMQPIVGFNYGAQQYKRVAETFKVANLYSFSIMLIGLICIELFTYPITRLFTTNAELIDRTVYGMRVISITLPVVGFCILSSTFFQSIGKAVKSITMSFIRQGLFLIPMLVIFPKFLGVKGVWISMPLSDVVATITGAILILAQLNEIKKRELAVIP